MNLRVNNLGTNNYNNKRNVNFGRITAIEKVMIDGKVADEYSAVFPVHGLIDVLLKRNDVSNGDAIRAVMAKFDSDYKIPEEAIQDPKKFPVRITHGDIKGEKLYLLTGEDISYSERTKQAFIDAQNLFDKGNDGKVVSKLLLESIAKIKEEIALRAAAGKSIIVKAISSNDRGSIIGTKFTNAEFIDIS